MVTAGSAAIAIEKQLINDLNVFPVPDGDTGTNMTLTMGAGVTELQKKNPATVSQAAEVTASALLRGARGNSGVILSLLFRGLSKGLKDLDEADGKVFAKAMVDGVDAAYKAVMKPAEGTMLTVSRVASAAALEFSAKEPSIELVLEHAIKIGHEAVAETIEQNPVLKKAGVIDAGGKGYVIILEGMLRALRGEEITERTASASEAPAQAASEIPVNPEDITFTYCTEFIIERTNQKDPNHMRGLLDGIGDSLVVVDDETMIKVHVHTDDPGRALTEGLAYGSLHNIKIENMREQHAALHGGAPAAAVEDEHIIAPVEKPIGIVAVSAGEGLAHVFGELGVDKVVTGGQTMNPSTDDIVRAVDAVPAETVYVFPNNKNIILAAQQAVPLASKKVIIIPTQTIPQGVAALLAFDPTATEADNIAALEEAVSRVKTAQITYASRDAEFDGHNITEGQFLSLFDSSILTHGEDFDYVIDKTIAEIASYEPEFITIFYGEDVDEARANAVAEAMTARVPSAEITVLDGGQPVYYFMISVE